MDIADWNGKPLRRLLATAERFSDAHREAVQEEEEFHAQRITRRIRELYFAVQNIELRKELIAKDREEGGLALSYCQQELTEAGARLATARSTQNHWWVWTSLVGIALLALGFYFFGLIGALGGALVGSLNGRRMEQEALRARDAAVASAEQELKEAEQFWNKARNEPQTFSRREANTGEPDPQVHLRAV